MNNYKSLRVYYEGQRVGTLAAAPHHLIAFEYDDKWIADGFSLNPLSLPLQKGVFMPKDYDPFEGLFGVFADSLPDGWGRLLVTDQTDNLDELYQMGGTSGGARPKVYMQLDGAEWIVKFPSTADHTDIGKQEYDYSLCAKKCGILMPETKLLPSSLCSGYFAVRRFDREMDKRIHMVSASGLLETSHRIPNLDYDLLMRLTMILTQDYDEIEKLYRLMCFNVFAHNRDDHSKNFSYLYKDGRWQLSPAYDLTYSNSIGGEHATTVNGNGRNPGMSDLLAVARKIEFDSKKAKGIAEEIRDIVHADLGQYLL